MKEHILVKTLYGNIVQYQCPNCGSVIELPQHIKDMFIENDVPYMCEDCGELIILNNCVEL